MKNSKQNIFFLIGTSDHKLIQVNHFKDNATVPQVDMSSLSPSLFVGL
jgi:hypothetical protein